MSLFDGMPIGSHEVHRAQRNHGEPRTYTNIYRTCQHCGEFYRVKANGSIGKYHSRECYFVVKGAKAKQRAAALEAQRQAAKVARRCVVCGRACSGRACSNTCRRKHDWARIIAERPLLPCPECGAVFRLHQGRMVCSVRCGRRVAKRLRQAAKRAQRVERIEPLQVFARDGWRCRSCHRSTPRRLMGTLDMRAPTVDHIVPFARGGAHTWANVQTLCRRCNGRKSAKVQGQLRLDWTA